MNAAERSRRAFEIFDEVCELAADARGPYMAVQCGGDAELRREVESLLAHDPDAGAVAGTGVVAALESGAAVEALAVDLAARDQAATVPEQVGPYRILREIGRGGMGVIYEAEQESPRRRVALKLIRPGALSADVIRRFRHEVLVLGKLQHPGIAQIFEAGFTDLDAETQPFLAMEMVDGKRLDHFAAERRIDLESKLELVARICDAVQHAHQKGIIHRDLKPANVLVIASPDGDGGGGAKRSGTTSSAYEIDSIGQPKILDFGIARFTGVERQQETRHTLVGQLVGTLAYMSPEQVSGKLDDIDTRSDVYALGVLLYELLTGRLPHDVKDRPLVEAARMIERDEPVRVGAIDSSLRGDVEAILGRAMEKQRENRYESAAAMAADIRRSLRNEPILARPATTAYYLRKFVRRHRPLVFGAAALAFILLAGAIGTTLGFLSATRANDELAETNVLLERSNEDLGKSNALLEQANEDLGESNLALAAVNRELEDANRLLDASLEEARIQAENARAVIAFLDDDLLASVQPSSDPGRGRDVTMHAVLEEAGRRIESSAAPGGRLEGKPLIEATVRGSIGGSYRALGEFDKAQPHLERCHALRLEHLGPDHADTLQSEVELAYLAVDRGDFIGAADRLRPQIERLDSIADPAITDLRWRAFLLLALSLTRTSADEALVYLTDLLERAHAELGEDHEATVATTNNLATCLARLERFAEALPLLKTVLDRNRRVLGEAHPSTLAAMMSYAHVQSRMGHRSAETMNLLARAYELHVEVFGSGHPAAVAAATTFAYGLLSTRRAAEAIELLLAVLESGRQEMPDDHPEMRNARQALATAYSKLERWDDAVPALEAVLRDVRKHAGPDNMETWNAATLLATAYIATGRFEDTVALLTPTYEKAVDRLGREHRLTFHAGLRLGKALVQLDRLEQAEPILIAAYRSAVAMFGNHPGVRDYAGAVLELYETWQQTDPAVDRSDEIAAWRRRAR